MQTTVDPLPSATRAHPGGSARGPVVLILLLAAAVRILGVADRPVWTDEGWSVWAASDHSLSAVWDKLENDRHPPLYFLTLSGWWSLAGESRLALRYPSILAGLLTVAAAYRTGADWLGRRAACYGAALLAVLTLAVYYTQEIRHYGFLILGVSLVTLTFLRFLRRPGWRIGAAYALSIAFMLYSLYLGALVLMVQGVVGLLLWNGSRRHKAGLVAAVLAALVLYAPWLAVIVRQWGDLDAGIGGFPGSYSTRLANIPPVIAFVFGSQVALLAGAYALGLWHLARERSASLAWLARLYLALGGVGLFVFMFVANLWFGLVSARTLAFLTPALLLFCGYGLSRLPAPARDLLAIAGVLGLLAFSDVVQPRLAYDDAARVVGLGYSPGDLIVLETGWDDNAFMYEVMLATGDDDAAIVRTLPWVDHTRPERLKPVVDMLADDLAAARRVWVVQWLQASKLIPYLDEGGAGFQRVAWAETPIGAEYEAIYPADPDVTVALYARPQADGPPRLFGETLALRDALLPDRLHAGDRLHVDLWWSAPAPPPLDYSVGVYLMPVEADRVLAQHDGPPGDLPTSQWTPDLLVFDRHTLVLPNDLPSGRYRVTVGVYWFGDRQPLPVDGAPYTVVGTLDVP